MDKMDGMTMNIEQENVEKLKEVFPEVFADGKVDFDKLQGLLGHYIADDKEKYSFSWKGKADSLRLAQKRSTGTLRPCKEESKNWDTTENLYIEGDNLEVLKLLQSSYLNSIKMIYIDPPYNTGNDFVYTDDFADGIAHYKEVTGQATKSNPETAGRYHTNWLNMMYPRLKLARNLLTDDGVIFISIDENEIANLRKICNEVFGEDNFIGTFIWRKKDGGGQAKDYFVIEHEYIVGYRKSDALLWEDEKEIRDINEYKKIDARGRYKITKLAKWGNTARREDRPSMYFPLNAPDGTLAYPIAPDGNDGRWRIGKEKMKELVQNDLIYWEKKNDLWIPYEKEYFTNQSKIIKQRSILYDVANTGDGTDCLTELFGIKDIFENPKPYEIVIKLLKPITTKNDIILDFFSGSATMAHAVMKLNAEDGFNRKYICVQLPEKTEPNSVANKAGYQTICEIGKERIRRAGEKIKDGHSRVDIYLSAIDEIVKNKYIMAQIESYVRDVKDKWIENEDDPEINTDKVIETIKTIINSEDDAIADESTYERGGEKLSDLVMRLAYEVTGLTFGVDIGFKVFKLDSSNLVKWDNTPTTDEEEVKKRIQKSLFYLVDGRSDLDLVYEIMLKYGLSLTLPVEERKFDNVPAYIINHPDYKVLVCLAPNITLSAVEEMDKETIGTYIFADRCFADANILSNTEEILKKERQGNEVVLIMVELLLSVEWNDTAIISSIVGVVGTILGTVIGFLLSVLSRSGRQNVICKGIELSYYYGVNDIGDRVYRKESNFDGKVPERTKLSLELLITNSSEMPFNMNLVKLIIKKGEETFHGNLLDKNINKGSNSIIIHENIKTKQIGGKNSIYLELYTQFNEVYVYKETDSFYIEYIDVKGRTIHKKIKMGGIHETEI